MWKSIRNKPLSIVILAAWVILLLVCFINRDRFSVDRIVSFTPKSQGAAVAVMLCLFAVKGVSVFIYGGLLYAASGILFPLPLAILVNMVGTVIMTTIPYMIGRRTGRTLMDQLVCKYPKLEIVRDAPSKNELFISFFVRIVGLLPGDIVGMYLGSAGILYSRYLAGTILGLFPAVISFSVMGMSAADVSSPAFIVSVGVECGLMLLSLVMYLIWRKKNGDKGMDQNPKKVVNTK